MNVKAFKITQRGEKGKTMDIYITVLPAKRLFYPRAKIYSIEIDKEKGYQRPLDMRRLKEQRARSPVKYLMHEEGTFPTSILLNVREKLKFTVESKLNGNIEFGTLEIPEESTLWIVDGQRRTAALNLAAGLSKKPEIFMEYPVPVSIFNTENIYEEMRQFYIVNSRQKSVKTDIAQLLLEQMYERLGLSLEETEGRKGVLTAKAVSITRIISEREPWQGLIGFPPERKIVPLRTFADSITYILRETTFKDLPLEDMAELLIQYWSAIREIFTKSFEDPEKYTLVASTGVYAFHFMFPTVYARCALKGNISAETMKEILNGLRRQGPQGIVFEKPISDEFWLKDKYGGRQPWAQQTSLRGIRRLAELLSQKLAR